MTAPYIDDSGLAKDIREAEYELREWEEASRRSKPPATVSFCPVTQMRGLRRTYKKKETIRQFVIQQIYK